MKKTSRGIMATLLLTSMLMVTFNIQVAVSSEPPETEWTRTYGGVGDDVGWSVIQTNGGGYAIAGWTISFGAGAEDFWLIKTDSAGNVQWNKTYGGISTAWYGERAYCLIQTSDGGYAIAGETSSLGAGSRDFWLVKTYANGTMQWNQTYGGTNQEEAYSVIQTSDGGYAIAGRTLSFGVAGYENMWLVKTNSTGDMEWNKPYGDAGIEIAYTVVQTTDGGYAIGGEKGAHGNVRDVWLVRTNSTGDMLWNKTYGVGTVDSSTSMVQAMDGGYALAGSTETPAGGFADFYLVKTDADGNMLWNKTYGGTGRDEVLSAVQTNDGGYALVGLTYSFGIGSGDFWLVKADANGNMQWNKTYGGAGTDWGYSVIQTNDGGYAIAGYTRSFGAGNSDMWLIKLAGARMRFDPKIDGFSFNNTIPKETISFEDAYDEISSAPWSSSVPQQYRTVLALLSVAVHNLQKGNCFGMSYTAKYYYENPSMFVSKYSGYSNMYEVDMDTASPEIVTNQFPGQEIIPPYLINIAIMYLRPNSLDEQVPWIMSQLDGYNVVQLYVDVPELDTFFPHSVLAYDYERIGNQVTLSIYDPNHSGKTRDIVLSKDTYGDYTLQGGTLVDDYGVTQFHAGEFYGISWPLLSGYIDELIQLVYDLVTSSCDDFLGFKARSPVNILVTAPNGSRVGYDPSTHSDVNEIVGATYSGAASEPQTILIPSPLSGDYTIGAFGTGTGNYTITIKSAAPNAATKDSLTLNGTASQGKMDTYSIELKEDYTIVQKPPSDLAPLLFLIATLVAAIVLTILLALAIYRRKRSQ